MSDDIRVITEPKAYVLARTHLDTGQLYRFTQDTGFPGFAPGWGGSSDAQTVTEVAARTCYRSFGKGRPHAEHIAHLIEAGHLSTFEHVSWTLLVTGVSRTLTHELVRHRHFSYSQESQRFVDASDVAFVLPPVMEAWKKEYDSQAAGWSVSDRTYWGPMVAAYDSWLRTCRAARNVYRTLAETLSVAGPADLSSNKQIREAARSVLPGCTETRIAVTGNARAWREYLSKRLVPAADAEHRRLAALVLSTLRPEAPGLFAGLGEPAPPPRPVEVEAYN